MFGFTLCWLTGGTLVILMQWQALGNNPDCCCSALNGIAQEAFGNNNIILIIDYDDRVGGSFESDVDSKLGG